MGELHISRRTVLGGALSAALLPALASETFASGTRIARASTLFGPASRSGRPRFLHTATALLTGEILMVGGYHVNGETDYRTGRAASSSVELYDPSTGLWRSVAPLRTPRARHAAALLQDGRLLVAGGVNRIVLDSVEIYDPAANVWTVGKSLAMPMMDHAMCAIGGQIVLSGGEAGASVLHYQIAAVRPQAIP